MPPPGSTNIHTTNSSRSMPRSVTPRPAPRRSCGTPGCTALPRTARRQSRSLTIPARRPGSDMSLTWPTPSPSTAAHPRPLSGRCAGSMRRGLGKRSSLRMGPCRRSVMTLLTCSVQSPVKPSWTAQMTRLRTYCQTAPAACWRSWMNTLPQYSFRKLQSPA